MITHNEDDDGVPPRDIVYDVIEAIIMFWLIGWYVWKDTPPV